MSYPNYLIHFNRNHDKLGRFAIGDGDGDGIRDDHSNQEKQAYNGQSRKEYIKNMTEQYKSNGHGNIKARRYAKNAADQNQWETKQYNKSLKKVQKNKEKAMSIFNENGHNIDDVRIQKLAKEAVKEYKTMQTLDVLLQNDYKVGEMFARSYADALLGVPKYNPNLDMKLKAVAML